MAKRIPHEELAKSAWAVSKLGAVVLLILVVMAIAGKSVSVGAIALLWMFLFGPLADTLGTLAAIGARLEAEDRKP